MNALNFYVLIILCILIALDIVAHVTSMIISYHVRSAMKVVEAAVKEIQKS